MGKKKQAQRTKNNVVPASSGRSAQMLQSSPGVPFVGFSTLKEGGFIPILTGINDELDLNINEDFRLVWKKMNKKDTTTKLKALDEFKKLCQESDVEAIKSVLPYWPRLFCSLSTDEEHRVREAAHAAHRALVGKAGRNIAPYLKQLVGPWFTGQHDTYPPAASTAETSFQETFPPNKLIEAIVFCQEEILNYICNNLLNETPHSLASNQNDSQEAKDARYQRVVVSCLNGYALYLQRLPTEHLRKTQEANYRLVGSAKFWKFNKNPAPIVRAAWFTALVALCEKAPFLLAAEAKHVCAAVLTNIDDSDPTVVHSLWQAVLLTFNVVEDVWQYVSLEKLVLPKLWKVLKEGANGNASLILPNLLPLISKISPTLLNERTSFYSKLLENLRTGLKARNVQISAKETSAVVTAFLECLRFVISINSDDEKQCICLFEEQVFSLMEGVMTDSKLQLARTCLFCGLASLVNHWSKQAVPPYITLTNSFWQQITVMCRTVLQKQVTDSATLIGTCDALDMLLVSLKSPDIQSRKSFRVKFVSPRKSEVDEVEEPSFIVDRAFLTPSFIEERTRFIQGHLKLCFDLLCSSSEQTKVVLIRHLAHTIEEYESKELYHLVLIITQMDWSGFYSQVLASWLRDANIPLACSLKVIFSLLKYVDNDNDVQMVYSDLSGVKWQDILEWTLQPEHQTECVKRWIISSGGVCQLAKILCHHDASYNILHSCLCNLWQNTWLTADVLSELVRNLRHNLTSCSVSTEVKTSSADLLYTMMQNTANHALLAQLSTEDLRSLLYELFTANLQKLPHFPAGWQHCIAILSLKSDFNLTFAVICETCVDLMIAVIKTRSMSLIESQQLVSVLEELVLAAVVEEEFSAATATLLGVVLSRMCARLREDEEEVWRLYALTEYVDGSLRDFSLPHMYKDPLTSVPVQQYVTSMIPFLMMVVRLQTSVQTGHFPYAQLRSCLPADDLWDWCLQVLQLQSICVSFKNHFAMTKQYFALKEKITFILEECGLFSQLRLKDIIKHLNLSLFEEGGSSLTHCDPLVRLQKETVLKDLSLLYSVQQIQQDLLPYKSRSTILRHNFFPNDVLEEISCSDKWDKRALSVVNTCCRRRVALCRDSDPASDATHIGILDRIFDQYVSEQKENRSLLSLSDEELDHIAEVADFARHSVIHDNVHLKQSSWDACLVATAALTLSASSTLEHWRLTSNREQAASQPSQSEPKTTPASHSLQPWPLSLLLEVRRNVEEYRELLRLPVMRVLCAVCRLFDTISEHMCAPDAEDKAAVTRCTEWTEVFLPSTHAGLTEAWLTVAELQCKEPLMILLIEALSSSVARFVQYPHFVNSDTLGCLDSCCRLLQSSETSVQLAAYHLLIKLIPAMIELDMKECEKDNVALSCQHVDKTLVYTQSIIDTILSGLSFGDTCIVEPFTDSYTYTRCYLLLWCALLELCANSHSQLRALYTTWLKEEYLSVFMKTMFCLMPETALHSDIPSQRIAQFFSKAPQFDKGMWSSDRLAQLSCWVFACALRRLPAAVRHWWNEAEHRVYCLVEHVTATYVSPDLCAEEMRAIQAQEKKFDNMTIHVHSTAKEVYAVYMVEESRMELVIELAHNHPLGLVKVKSGQRMVSTTQTRQWLLQITIFLTHQNGSIWDALELWKTSLDKRFEGVEECYICFAILHSVSHQLPKLSCQTCRKKFHSHCLYKWFTTSNKSTCPICRNLF